LSLWAAVAFSAPALGGLVIGLAAEVWGLGATTVTAGLLCTIPAAAVARRLLRDGRAASNDTT
jgi:hypothetical protein